MRFLKHQLYFIFAAYFKFWAILKLRKWQPLIVVLTASSGKTTLLNLLASQIGRKARYSHLANSSFGIPFHILGINRKNFTLAEWPQLFLQAPMALLSPVPQEKIYIVEADCDRPYEGEFLATLLRPDITLWLNVSRTHTQNFDSLVNDHRFSSIEKAISYEFGHFLVYTKDLILMNGNSALMAAESTRARSSIKKYHQREWLTQYTISKTGTMFLIDGKKHLFTGMLLPQDVWLSIVMCLELCQKLKLPYDFSYTNFTLPPGRSSLFLGIKNTTLIDSSYNSNYDSMRAMLDLFKKIPTNKKWLVLGDMVELGEEEAEEHAKLGQLLTTQEFDQLILIGPRLQKYTVSLVKNTPVVTFLEPKAALHYILNSLTGGETLLFKGSRFLEGIIAQLLADKKDISKLCRREQVWQNRRQRWGL